MRRNFDQVILDINDNAMNAPDGGIATLATVAINALLATYEDERTLSGKEKAERMQLALRINRCPMNVDVSAEQLAKVKELIGKAFGPLVVGRAYELLEQEPHAVREVQ